MPIEMLFVVFERLSNLSIGLFTAFRKRIRTKRKRTRRRATKKRRKTTRRSPKRRRRKTETPLERET